jgi:hypothetical protein
MSTLTGAFVWKIQPGNSTKPDTPLKSTKSGLWSTLNLRGLAQVRTALSGKLDFWR